MELLQRNHGITQRNNGNNEIRTDEIVELIMEPLQCAMLR